MPDRDPTTGQFVSGGVKAGSAFVVIGADMRPLIKAMRSVQTKIKTLGTSLSSIGKKMTLAGAGLGAPFLFAIRAASKFEDAMIELEKVTDSAVSQELANRMEMLSKTTSTAANDLIMLAADAARFGIKGTENIEMFVKVVNKMAVATDLTTDQAGVAFAKLTTQLKIPIGQVENLGSAINALANNFATSSSEIVDSLLRSAGAMEEFGLTAQEAVGLSAVMNEFSESAERAGTRIRSLLDSLRDPAVVGRMAKVLGITVDAFRNLQKRSPRGAILALARAMGEGGDKAFQLRGAMDRVAAGALAKLGSNLERVREALELSNDEFEKATSLQIEYEAAQKSFSTAVKIVWNNITALAKSIGMQLTPELVKYKDVLVTGIATVDAFVRSNGALVLAVAGVAAGLVAVGATLVGLGIGFKILSVAIGGLALAFGVVLKILAMFFTAATWLPSLFIAIIASFSGLGEVVIGVAKDIAMSFMEMIGDVAKAFETGGIEEAVEVLAAHIKRIWKQLTGGLREMWEKLQFVLVELLLDFQEAFVKVGSLLKMVWVNVVGFMKRTFLKAWNTIKGWYEDGVTGFAVLFAKLDPSLDEEQTKQVIDNLLRANDNKQQAINEQEQKDIRNISKQQQSALADATKQRTAALDEVDQKRATNAARFQAELETVNAEIRAAEAGLANARKVGIGTPLGKKFKKRLDEAKVRLKALGESFKLPEGAQLPQDSTIVGSFGLQAAEALGGIGSDVDMAILDVNKQQLEQQKETNKKLDKDKGGLNP